MFGMITPRPPIECADGTTVSVQASWFHYCTPKEDVGPYTHVEVGFPTVEPEWWEEHDGDDVAGYVPVELVIEFLEAHGGPVPEWLREGDA